MFVKKTTVRKRIGRLAVASVTAAGGVVGLSVSPAAADQPLEFSGSRTITAHNPCTGELIDVMIDFEARLHLHDNGNVIAHFSRTGTTSDGYVMRHGVDTYVANRNVARGAVHDTWRNADGSVFKTHAHFTAKASGPVVDSFTLQCVKP